MTEALWVGWLYGDHGDRENLISLGVEGPMVFRYSDTSASATPGASEKEGVFEHCWVKPDFYDALAEGWPVFAKTFTLLEGDDLEMYLDEQAPVAEPELEDWR